ncbi:MAG TPA: protein translocase subunit SecF [Candidatus Nitrosotalea sp.]|nr:protein translocase subunit SecF [Candidatus Nitrosotalea sp.]
MEGSPDLTAAALPAQPQSRVRTVDVVGHRNWYFALSLVIILPGMFFMVTRGFLLGIDFAGGTEFFYQFQRPASVSQIQSVLSADGVTGSVQAASKATYIIRTGPMNPGQQQTLENDLEARLGPINQSTKQINEVGPSIASETVTGALYAIISASILILLYLAFRFRKVQGGWRSGFQFGGSALLALLHDVFVLTGVFSILGEGLGLRVGQIDSLFLTAVLTVVGFSVHDTIVVFDRVRENLILSQRLTFEQVVNLSIMQTAARSIITSFTVVLVLLALILFGGETLRGFILALLIGIISGTYSSIFNASQLLVVWRKLQPVR